jgi:hypothetical protein
METPQPESPTGQQASAPAPDPREVAFDALADRLRGLVCDNVDIDVEFYEVAMMMKGLDWSTSIRGHRSFEAGLLACAGMDAVRWSKIHANVVRFGRDKLRVLGFAGLERIVPYSNATAEHVYKLSTDYKVAEDRPPPARTVASWAQATQPIRRVRPQRGASSGGLRDKLDKARAEVARLKQALAAERKAHSDTKRELNQLRRERSGGAATRRR